MSPLELAEPASTLETSSGAEAQFRGRQIFLQHLYISPAHNFFGHYGQLAGHHPILEMPRIRCLAGRGVIGDRFFDFKESYKGQVTFFEKETYDAICGHLAVCDRSPAVFRRNVITRGLDLNQLIGADFELQGVRFRGAEECRPCLWMDQTFGPGAEKFLLGRGGLRAVILTDGVLAVGDG